MSDDNKDAYTAMSDVRPLIIQPSKLLNLPAEIRNQIWLHTFPPEATITKEAPRAKPPAITFACRQTWTETIVTFTETIFVAKVVDWDGTFTHILYNSIVGLKVLTFEMFGRDFEFGKGSEISILSSGRPHWKNLLLWAELDHAFAQEHGTGIGGSNRMPSGPSAATHVVSAVLNIAYAMRGVPWEEATAALENLHLVAIASDPRWY